jgi:hypothetical protein
MAMSNIRANGMVRIAEQGALFAKEKFARNA